MMKFPWLVDVSIRFGIVLLLAGCTITIGPFDEITNDSNTPESPLPEPPQTDGNQSALDDAQQARKLEVDKYILEVVYQSGNILKTFQFPSGDIADFIERDSLPALPFGLPVVPWTLDDLTPPPGVTFGLTELEQIPELVALAAQATPFHRPTYWPYILGETDAISIEDYLDRYQLGGQPTSTEHLYAGLMATAPNRGVTGYMNQFRPVVEAGSLSLIEFAVACPADGPTQEAIGVVISVDKVNGFGTNHQALMDGEPRMHVEYARTDPATGKFRYTWDGFDGRFRANPFRTHQPGQKVPVSVLGGTQVEHLASIFQAPNGDWWIASQGDLIGYYPSGLFSLLNGGACRTLWYGEVARSKPANSTGWAKTEMGSGRFAKEEAPNAAYVRRPSYYDINWFTTMPSNAPPFQSYKEFCYTRSDLLDGVFKLGGPGGKAPGCVVP